MKHIIKYAFTFLILHFTYLMATAQIAINEDNSNPDTSAMLDISSTDKGILIPRMDSTNRKNILNPAIGLIVYDSTTLSFWYFDNTDWTEVGQSKNLAFTSENGIITASNTNDDFLVGAATMDNGGSVETKLFFNDNLGAFRAGQSANSNWDTENLGQYSIGLGRNTLANKSGSIAIGYSTEATGSFSTSLGYLTKATGNTSMSLGAFSDATGVYAHAFGLGAYAPSYAETALGTFNTSYTPINTDNYNASDRLLVIGNGQNNNNRSDAMIIYKSGDMEINGNVSLSGDLFSDNGLLTVDDNVSINGNLTLTGDLSDNDGTVTVDDNLKINESLDVVGTLFSSSNLVTIDDNLTVNENLTVNGVFFGNNGTLTIDDNLRVNNNLTVIGNLFGNNGTLTIDDNLTVSDDLRVNGNLISNNSIVTVNDNLTVDEDLTVTGNLLGNNGTLTVNDHLAVNDNLTISGDLLGNNGTVTVGDNLTIDDNLRVKGNLLGNNGTLTVNDELLVKDDFKVEGEKIGENSFIAIFENTTDDNSDQNDGVQIIAGHTSYDSDHQSGFLRFVRPDGQQCGRVRQEGGSSVRYATSSDIRLKENIQRTQYGLADILNIQVRDYNFINDKEEYQQTGFLAQQLYTIFPIAVEVGGDDVKNDPWTVDYGSLTPLLVKGMQEQQEIIKDLKNEIEDLKTQVAKIERLEAMLETLQAAVK